MNLKVVSKQKLKSKKKFLFAGYKTAFAWLCEAEKKTVPSEIAEKFLQFQIPCGRFSYASIPGNHFDCVLGVTGTLSCLTPNERKLIRVSLAWCAMILTLCVFIICFNSSMLSPRSTTTKLARNTWLICPACTVHRTWNSMERITLLLIPTKSVGSKRFWRG